MTTARDDVARAAPAASEDMTRATRVGLRLRLFDIFPDAIDGMSAAIRTVIANHGGHEQGRREMINTSKKQMGLKVSTGVKAGGFSMNHNRAGLKVRASVKAGGLSMNHNRRAR